MDFLRALDQIIDRAVAEPVDLVIFAGDAYKDRNPHPTFQREWGKRMMRLSQAGIPTVLLVGNHDVSPASGRAHTLHEYQTLHVPGVHVADRIVRLDPDQLGVPVQIITVPWVSRSQLMSRAETAGKTLEEILIDIEDRVTDAVLGLIDAADPKIPLILTAHASVQGARYGSERAVMLGHELVLSGNLVHDRRLDYVALGHIHKRQALHAEGAHPPVVYPGSIERIDFGEVRETKGYALATVAKGKTAWEFVDLDTRPFYSIAIEPEEPDTFMEHVMAQLPPRRRIRNAVCRVQLTYSRDWESLLDEKAILDHFQDALSIQIQKHRRAEKRARLGQTTDVEALSPGDLLETYWRTIGLEADEVEAMQALAQEILSGPGESAS
jgi:exonuclease SbcD